MNIQKDFSLKKTKTFTNLIKKGNKTFVETVHKMYEQSAQRKFNILFYLFIFLFFYKLMLWKFVMTRSGAE